MHCTRVEKWGEYDERVYSIIWNIFDNKKLLSKRKTDEEINLFIDNWSLLDRLAVSKADIMWACVSRVTEGDKLVC